MRPLNPGDAKETHTCTQTHTHLHSTSWSHVCARVCVCLTVKGQLFVQSVFMTLVLSLCSVRVCVSFIHYAKVNLSAGHTLFLSVNVISCI